MVTTTLQKVNGLLEMPDGLTPADHRPLFQVAGFELLGMTSAGAIRVQPNDTSTMPRRYSLYTPELSLLAETENTTSESPAVETEYVWFGGQPIAQIDNASGAVAYYFNDHLGTPILQTDSSATVIWRAEYEPFGKVYAFRAGSEHHQPLRFPGQEDNGGEEVYNIFRWYRAGWGHYSSPDPVGLNSDTNLYRYTYSNPIVGIDPLGLAVWFCSRKTTIGIFNHGYLWDDRPTTRPDEASCGQGNNSGHEMGPQRPGLPPGWGDQCTRVPGSDNQEDSIMRCCGAERTRGFWWPFTNDCHAVAGRCLERVLGQNPGAPGGRVGDPCDRCRRAPQRPRDDPPASSPYW